MVLDAPGETVKDSAVSGFETAALDTWLDAILTSKVRGTAATVEAHLWEVGEVNYLADSKTTLRVHFLKKDANGNVRVAPLVQMLATKVIDYCIPRSRIEKARELDARFGSTDATVALADEARNLFADIKLSGEGGELLLYFLLETVLGVPQILCKMPLKTSSNMHYHGVDGVHAKVVDAKTLAVYWGESKLYASPRDGIRACLDSITPFILDDGTGASERDRLLVRDHIDINDPDVEEVIKLFFDLRTEESTRLECRAACLVGFSQKDYPHPFESTDGPVVTPDVLLAIEDWAASVASGVKNRSLTKVEIEFFCLPFPDVSEFRKSIARQLGIPFDESDSLDGSNDAED
jgi:hypothetical protein